MVVPMSETTLTFPLTTTARSSLKRRFPPADSTSLRNSTFCQQQLFQRNPGDYPKRGIDIFDSTGIKKHGLLLQRIDGLFGNIFLIGLRKIVAHRIKRSGPTGAVRKTIITVDQLVMNTLAHIFEAPSMSAMSTMFFKGRFFLPISRVSG